MNYLLGASGLIGSAISSQLDSERTKIIMRDEYQTWHKLENINTGINNTQTASFSL